MFKLSKLSRAMLGAGAVVMTSAATPAFAQTDAAADSGLEVMTVTGIRGSLNSALDRKRNSSTIQDSIIAEDIGKFPDQNVAESLQRIPGVSISRTNGEGSQVTVRGFGPEFNTIKLNGRTLATTKRSRNFDFQILPAEMIGGADVVKSPSASTADGSVGALVNVRTARPLDSDGLTMAASVEAKHNDLSGDTGVRISGLFSNTFADGKVGVLVGVSHQDTDNRIDQTIRNRWATVNASQVTGAITNTSGAVVTPSELRTPGRQVLTVAQENRERTGINAVVQFAASDSMTHTIDYLQTDFDRTDVASGIQIPFQRSGWADVVVSDNNTVVSATKFGRQPLDAMIRGVGEESTLKAYGYNFEGSFGRTSINFDLAYSEANSSPQNNELVPNIVDGDVNNPNAFFQFDTRSSDVLDFNTSIDLSDPGSIRNHWNRVRDQELSDEVLELSLDANIELDSGIFQSVDVGFFASDRDKVSITNSTLTGCGGRRLRDGTTFGINACGGTFDLPDNLFAGSAFPDFLSNEAGNIPRDFITVTDVDAYLAAVGSIRGDDFPNKSVLETSTLSNTEETQGVYAQLNFEKDALRGNVGLRYVETESSSTGFTRARLSTAPLIDGSGELKLTNTYTPNQPLTQTKEYDNLLPSLNIAYDLNDNMLVRFAAAKTIARPSINDTGVGRSFTDVSAASFASRGGNPDLDPYEVSQLDLSFEYYQDNGNAYGVNLFSKDIKTFISTLTTRDDTPDILVNGEFVDSTVIVPGFGQLVEVITQKENRTGGDVKGIELSALHYFDSLPGIWGGLGIQANYTYAKSKDNNARPVNLANVVSPTSGLEGFAKNTYNIVLFLENDKFETRLAYNYRDTFLKSRTGSITGGLPEHVENYGQLDFRASYNINDKYSVSFDATNLTNERVLEFADIRERVTRIQYTGARYGIGFRGKF